MVKEEIRIAANIKLNYNNNSFIITNSHNKMEPHLSTKQIIRNSILKLLFELIGTMFLTLIFNASQTIGEKKSTIGLEIEDFSKG